MLWVLWLHPQVWAFDHLVLCLALHGCPGTSIMVCLFSIQALEWSLWAHSSLRGGRSSHLGLQGWQHHLFLQGGQDLATKVSKTRADRSCFGAAAAYR